MLTPEETLLLLLAFHATRSERFSISVIRETLKVALETALQSSDAEDFRKRLEETVASSGEWKANAIG